jgi:hypothetical protein
LDGSVGFILKIGHYRAGVEESEWKEILVVFHTGICNSRLGWISLSQFED